MRRADGCRGRGAFPPGEVRLFEMTLTPDTNGPTAAEKPLVLIDLR